MQINGKQLRFLTISSFSQTQNGLPFYSFGTTWVWVNNHSILTQKRNSTNKYTASHNIREICEVCVHESVREQSAP